MNGHVLAVNKLLSVTIPCHVNVDIVNNNGNSALHMAAMGGHGETVEALVLAGSDTLIVNADGKIAMEVSVNQEVFHILRNCELIRNMRRQIGSMHGFRRKRKKTPYQRKSTMKYNANKYEPVCILLNCNSTNKLIYRMIIVVIITINANTY